jgi:hypothetical protein
MNGSRSLKEKAVPSQSPYENGRYALPPRGLSYCSDCPNKNKIGRELGPGASKSENAIQGSDIKPGRISIRLASPGCKRLYRQV